MEQDSLFSIQEDTRPLADRMRPETLDEYVGQKQLVAKGNLLWQMIEHDQVTSMIFWGPPGVGKTTLARIIAHQTKSYFVDFSAVTSGIKEIKEVMKQADTRRALGQKTILFVDEILYSNAQFYSSMKFIVLIRRNKMHFYPMWKREVSF